MAQQEKLKLLLLTSLEELKNSSALSCTAGEWVRGSQQNASGFDPSYASYECAPRRQGDGSGPQISAIHAELD